MLRFWKIARQGKSCSYQPSGCGQIFPYFLTRYSRDRVMQSCTKNTLPWCTLEGLATTRDVLWMFCWRFLVSVPRSCIPSGSWALHFAPGTCECRRSPWPLREARCHTLAICETLSKSCHVSAQKIPWVPAARCFFDGTTKEFSTAPKRASPACRTSGPWVADGISVLASPEANRDPKIAFTI